MMSFGRLSVGRTASRLARVVIGKGEKSSASTASLQRGISARPRNNGLLLSTRSALGSSYGGGNRLALMKLPRRQLSAVPKGEAEQAETGMYDTSYMT